MALTSAILAIDVTAATSGGGASRTRELVDSLPLLAPQNRYAFFLQKALAERLPRSAAVSLFQVPALLKPVPLRVVWEHFWLPREARRIQPDWLLSPFNVLPLASSLPSTVRTSVIVSSISPFAQEVWEGLSTYQMARLRFLRTLTLASVKRASKVFFLSELGYRLVGPVVRDSQVAFLPMAPPSPALLHAAERVRIPEDLIETPFFVSVGDLAPYKGVEDAIRAIALVRQEAPTCRLVVCGRVLVPRYGSRLRALAGDLGGVVFLGGVKQEMALALMRRSLAVVVSSRIENPNRVPAEAMAVAAPLLAVDVPSSREACEAAAAYYPPGDHRALSSLMQEMADPVRREQLVREGHQYIRKNDWLSASRKMLEAMELL